MNTAFDIPGHGKLIDDIGKQWYKHIKKLFSDIDFWESINN